MRDFGAVTTSNWRQLLTVLLNPWIVFGICLLILFFCSYLTALSWADLTYVLPATALSYVLMALLAKIFLHENVTLSHWLGIGLITAGSGFRRHRPAFDRASAIRCAKNPNPQQSMSLHTQGSRSEV